MADGLIGKQRSGLGCAAIDRRHAQGGAGLRIDGLFAQAGQEFASPHVQEENKQASFYRFHSQAISSQPSGLKATRETHRPPKGVSPFG